ncbi:Uncharacterized protein APZ42_006036 [Daphnia magna]|uniref:Peptidase A2 domain-containing protein n=1 Tax=Daphnia magna TaxID=35525 RepID=A0A164G493_9CRUS|nr:Uncharacterized protein APZ42_006036 [Daphnia magna]
MVVLDVLCWRKRVAAVTDTGAVVSVCSPKLVRELGITVTPWRANRLVSVDGKEIQPGRASRLSVSDGRMTVEGQALDLDGDIDLLLGKDMLEKLGTWMRIGALPEILHWRHCPPSTGGGDDGGSTETSSPERMLGHTPIDESGRKSTTRFERVW